MLLVDDLEVDSIHEVVKKTQRYRMADGTISLSYDLGVMIWVKLMPECSRQLYGLRCIDEQLPAF
jgi:hypothetical protein